MLAFKTTEVNFIKVGLAISIVGKPLADVLLINKKLKDKTKNKDK